MANGKTIKTSDDANLGIAILVAEFGPGHYQLISPVSSISEAREIAASDMRARTKELERGGEPACPERYVVWAQDADGSYRLAKEIMP